MNDHRLRWKASGAGRKAGARTWGESRREANARSRRLPWAGSLGLAAIAAAATGAGPPPNLVDMHPHGGQQGQALRLVIEGYGVGGEMEVESTLPGSFARLGEADGEDRLQKLRRPDDRNLDAAVFIVEIAADAMPGLYPVRTMTRDGLSNALLFRVDTLPEVSEQSLSDSPAKGDVPRIEGLPIVINGTLDGAERDRYRFQAAEGERIVLEVEARRVGSAIDPALRLLDHAGDEIAFNQEAPGIDVDARLDWQAPEGGGEFVVEVHDARFSDQRRNFYRLKLIPASDYEYAEAVFPLGGRRGQDTSFEFSGGAVAATRELTRTVDTANALDLVGPGPGDGKRSAALPFPVAVSSHPEVRESDTDADSSLELPVIVNGRIDRSGEVDEYRIAAEPGRKLLIEVQGGALRSSDLFGVLTVTTPDGEYLASSGDDIPDPDTFRLLSPTATSFDPWVVVEAPAGVDTLHVAVEDLVGRDGPRFGYRLAVTEDAPDFQLRLDTAQASLDAGTSKPILVGAVRRGFLGPIRLYVKNPPAGIEARDGWIPREVRNLDRRSLSREGRIMVTADLDAPRERLDLEVWGEGVLEDGTVIRRRASVPGSVTRVRAGDGRSYTTEAERSFSAPWLESRLPVLLTGEPGPRLIGLAPETVRLVQGMPFHFQWQYEAPAGEEPEVDPPMVVSAVIGGGEFRVETTEEDDYDKPEGSKLIRTSDGTRHDRYTVTLTGEVTVDGRPERLYTPGVTLEVVPGYRIEMNGASIRSGRKGTVSGVLHREESFRQPVELRADALPTGVVCDHVEVKPEDDGKFKISCRASDDVEAGDYDILIASSSWLAGEREVRAAYTTAPVAARMEVKGR